MTLGMVLSVNRALSYVHLDYIIYPLRILNAKSKIFRLIQAYSVSALLISQSPISSKRLYSP